MNKQTRLRQIQLTQRDCLAISSTAAQTDSIIAICAAFSSS
jgi:hypothetical protein